MTGKGKWQKKGAEKGKVLWQGESILGCYLKERSALLLWFIFFVFLFLAVASLYGYDNSVANMWYAEVLALFFGVCGCFFDYLKYREKCMKLW